MKLFNYIKNSRFQNYFESTDRSRCISNLYSRIFNCHKIEVLTRANSKRLNIKIKLLKVHVYNKEYRFKTSFLLVKDLSQELILGTPFITQLYPLTITKKGIVIKNIVKELIFKLISPILPYKVLKISVLKSEQIKRK